MNIKNSTKNTFILSMVIVFIFSFSLIFFSNFQVNDYSNLAQSSGNRVGDYVSLTEVPRLTNEGGDGDARAMFAGYLQTMYIWGVSIAVALSIIMIIFGGIQYMTTDSISNKTDGKEKIKGAVVGLILALSSYLILNTINPQLVSLDVTVPEAQNPAE